MSCPNCGAPITGKTCEYCGTQHAKDVEQVTITIHNDYDRIIDWSGNEIYRVMYPKRREVVGE